MFFLYKTEGKSPKYRNRFAPLVFTSPFYHTSAGSYDQQTYVKMDTENEIVFEIRYDDIFRDTIDEPENILSSDDSILLQAEKQSTSYEILSSSGDEALLRTEDEMQVKLETDTEIITEDQEER